MSSSPIVYPPAEVARQLGVSASGLRRLARIYEEVAGSLPRTESGGRLWPEDAVERLRGAKALLEAGQVSSIAAGLAAPLAESQAALKRANEPDTNELLRALLKEVLELRGEVARLSARSEARQQGRIGEGAASEATRTPSWQFWRRWAREK